MNRALSADTVALETPVAFTVFVPGNTFQLQEWTLACHKVTGVLSVPASCGAEVSVKQVNDPLLILTDLPTTDAGINTVIAAFPRSRQDIRDRVRQDNTDTGQFRKQDRESTGTGITRPTVRGGSD